MAFHKEINLRAADKKRHNVPEFEIVRHPYPPSHYHILSYRIARMFEA